MVSATYLVNVGFAVLLMTHTGIIFIVYMQNEHHIRYVHNGCCHKRYFSNFKDRNTNMYYHSVGSEALSKWHIALGEPSSLCSLYW